MVCDGGVDVVKWCGCGVVCGEVVCDGGVDDVYGSGVVCGDGGKSTFWYENQTKYVKNSDVINDLFKYKLI